MSRGVLAIAIGGLASKGIGLVREVLFAAWFGTGATAAAFRIAQTGFLLPTHSFIGDTLSAGLLPLYRQLQAEEKDHARILVLVASIYGLVFSAVVTTLLFLYAESMARFIAPGASSGALELAHSLLKIMALATPFYVLSGMLGYIEAAHGKFGAIAWRPLLINVGSIAGAGLAVLTHSDHWLATGLLVGHCLFFIWTAAQVHKLDQLLPDRGLGFPLLAGIAKRFFLNMLPLLALPLLAQSNVLVERIVSSWLGTNVIPSLDYARIISETAIQLIALPLGVLTMAMHGGRNSNESRRHISTTAGLIMLVSFPAAVFVALNANPIVTLLFARGQFGAESVELTSTILRWLGAGLGASVTAYYLIKALNAQLRNKEALLITFAAAFSNVLVNLLLWQWLGPQTLGIGAVVYAVLLLALCLTRLELWSDLRALIGWLFAGCLVQSLASWYLALHFHFPYDLLFNALIAIAIWLPLIWWTPLLRRTAAPLISRIPLLNRKLG